jgi:hypothetical protein
MNRHLFTIAFLSGLTVVVWVGVGFMGSHVLALMMTALIAAVYLCGAIELRQFRQATMTLSTTLASIPGNLSTLEEWLCSVPPSLQSAVRLRIAGERVGLPGPALTPYLVGLLVMLGMLGTFLGMVVTLNGAALSLETTTDLGAIRAALAAPIKGLGLAFGTSVAGVATSAMLGLMSALSRRERMLTAQLLDSRIATSLRNFSLNHQRQETYKALQYQALALPEVVDKLQAMMTQMAHMSQQLNERLTSNQASFHSEVKGIYCELATSVDKSLKESLTQSAHVASESLRPIVEVAMTGMAQEARLMHAQVIDTAQAQLDGLAEKLNATASTVTETWTAALTTHERSSASMVNGVGQTLKDFADTFEQRSGSLLASVSAAYSAQQAEQALRGEHRQAVWLRSLEAIAATLQREWQQAGAQTLAQQQQICTTLSQTAHEITEQTRASANSTLGDITRLIGTASEAPRAAAEVIAQLRQEMSSSIARDNNLLEERSRIMATLNSLLETIHQAATQQHSVVDALVSSSAVALNNASSQFAGKVDLEASKLTDIAAHLTSSAVEVSSLGETFGFAVCTFNEANEKLIVNLQRIETAMDKSMTRSDDQLAYYVAQAREIVDLSIMSQREIFEELRQLPLKQTLSAEEVI